LKNKFRTEKFDVCPSGNKTLLNQGYKIMRKSIALAFIALSIIFMAACGGENELEVGASKKMALNARQVTVAPVSRADFALEVKSSGTLEPKNKAGIRALAGGPVDMVMAEIGDDVNKGQGLLRIRQIDARLAWEAAEAGMASAQAGLDNLMAWQRDEEVTIAEANAASARAQYQRLEKDQERAESIFAKGAISESQLLAARTAASSAEAAYQSAREALAIAKTGPTKEEIALARSQVKQAEAMASSAKQAYRDTVVTAPFSGVITESFLKTGDYAGRGDPVMEMVDDSFLEAESRMPERYLGTIKKGLAVTVKAASLPLIRQGEVIAVSPAVDPATRTFKVKIGVDNKDGYFSSGIFCSYIFKAESLKDAYGVPPEAIQNKEGRTFVWVNDNNIARQVFVTKGEGKDGFVHITEGLNGSEQVIVKGAGALSEGDSLEIMG
jgi:HlyD family secretion protein